MATTRDPETLQDPAGGRVNMEDMFRDPKEWRNPLVLFGAVATAGVLAAGLRSFQKGDSGRSQAMMRARVGMQAATVALMVGTVYYQTRGPATRNS